MRLTAYIPCFNERGSVGAAVRSLWAQTLRPERVLVVDDGSSDGSAEEAERAGAEVLRLGRNFGRGAARARAMEELESEFVLCCDANVALPEDFARFALEAFDNGRIAAVFGRITQPPGGGVAARWRGRHLFKLEAPRRGSGSVSGFATGGAMVRRGAVLECGNYNPSLRYGEDAELGLRLCEAGWTVWFDERLEYLCTARNTIGQVLERYWRWYGQPGRRPAIWEYLRDIWFSVKVMAAADLRRGDPACALVSLMCPHYRMMRSLSRSGGGVRDARGPYPARDHGAA